MVTRSPRPPERASARASSSRSRSRSGAYDSKSGLFQYESKVAWNFVSREGVASLDSRTFHSTPSKSALVDRLQVEEARETAIQERLALLGLTGQSIQTSIALMKTLGGGYQATVEAQSLSR